MKRCIQRFRNWWNKPLIDATLTAIRNHQNESERFHATLLRIEQDFSVTKAAEQRASAVRQRILAAQERLNNAQRLLSAYSFNEEDAEIIRTALDQLTQCASELVGGLR